MGKGSKGNKGTKGSRVPRYGTNLTDKTPRQPTSVIPESETAKQMVDKINPDTPRATQANKLPEELELSKAGSDLSWLDSLNDKEKDVLNKILNDDPLSLEDRNNIPNITSEQLESILATDKSLIPYIPEKIEKFRQIQSNANLLNLSFNGKVYQPWAKEYGERARPNSELVFSKRDDLPSEQSLTPYVDFTWRPGTSNLPSYNKYAVNRPIPYATHTPKFNLSPVKPLAAPYEYGPIVTQQAAKKAHIQKLNREIARDDAIKNGLWGLGILGATAGTFYGLDKLKKYIHSDNSDEQIPAPYQMEPKSEEEAFGLDLPVKTQSVNENISPSEPTLEQQYASQSIPTADSGIWGEKLNKLAHLNLKDFIPYSAIVPLSPFLNKEAFRQPQTVSSNFNDLVKSRYREASAVPSELPANIPQDNFVAPRELPAEGQTLGDYNKGNQPQEGVVLASQDTDSGPKVLNAPTEKKAVRKVAMPVNNKPVVIKPVQSENKLTEANLASAMVNKAVSPQVLQYGSPYYLQKNKPVDMRQWVRQKYGMSMSPAEMVQRGIMPYEYLQYW